MDLRREKIEISCPGGGRAIKTTYGDISKRPNLTSSKGYRYNFKLSDQVRLRRSMDMISRLHQDFERKMAKAQKELGENLSNVIGNADVIIKK